MKNKTKGDFAILFFVNDWLTSTASMSADCRGWYINLLCHNHDKGELPNDIEQLGILASVKFSNFKRFEEGFEKELRSKFVETENGGLTNPRLENIMQTRQRFVEKRTKSGKIGVLVKTAKIITSDADEIEFLKSKFDEVKESLSDRKELKQMLNHLLELYRNKDKSKEIEIEEKIPDGFLPIITTWLDYKKSKGQPYKNKKSTSAMVNKLIKLSDGNSVIAEEIINESISNNYAGFFAPKSKVNGLSIGQKTEQKHEKSRSY